jgi:hypothetical protein
MSMLVRSPGPVEVPARAANGRRYSLQVEQLSEFKTRTSRKVSVSSSQSKSFEVSQKGRMGKKDKRRLEVSLTRVTPVPSYIGHTRIQHTHTSPTRSPLRCTVVARLGARVVMRPLPITHALPSLPPGSAV